MADPVTIAASPSPAPEPGATPAPGATPVMPEGLPQDYWDADKGEVKFADFIKRYGELTAFKTQADARLAEVPARVEDYKAELPADLKLPVEIKIKADDPRFVAARALAHEFGLSQAAFSKLLGIEAQRVAAEDVALRETEKKRVETEMAKLGEKGNDRLKVVDSYLRSKLSAGQYQALGLALTNADAIAAIENLIAATNATLPDRNPGDPPPPPNTQRIADRWYSPPQQKAS